jgi:hypothetical protein
VVDGERAIEITLREPVDVGRRLVVLATLCRRAFLEALPNSFELDDDPEAEQFDLATWLTEHGLDGELTADERRLLVAPVGRLPGDETRAATWNAEALIALGWASGLLASLPDPIDLVDPAPVLQVVPAPWDDPRRWIAEAALRSEESIAFERERAEVWLWRAEIEEERRRLRGRARAELEADVGDVVGECVEAGLLPAGTRADFPVAGRPFFQIDPDQIDVIAGVAGVRLHALNWLCGFGSSWDDVPLDVE